MSKETKDKVEYAVHISHCEDEACKYGDDDCPVVATHILEIDTYTPSDLALFKATGMLRGDNYKITEPTPEQGEELQRQVRAEEILETWQGFKQDARTIERNTEKFTRKVNINKWGQAQVKFINEDEVLEEIVAAPRRLDPKDAIQYEKIKGPSIITTIRRFKLNKDTSELQPFERYKHVPGLRIALEGDIYEERFDLPNSFVNISQLERENSKKAHYFFSFDITWLNSVNLYTDDSWFNALDPIEDTPAQDSYYFKIHEKKAVSTLKRKIKKVATTNEEITNLKGILNITD